MSQRTFLVTGRLVDATGAGLAAAPCSVQIISPTGAPAIDGNGAEVQTAPFPFQTQPDGSYSQQVEYPGDFQTANCRVRVVENGYVTDAPLGFAYASSIATSTWYSAASTAGKVRMRLLNVTDAGVPIAQAKVTIQISQLAIDPNGASVASSAAGSVTGITDSTGTFAFWVWPNGVLNPTTTFYTARIAGESGTLTFLAPAAADAYQGAYAAGTTYHAASGTSAGDVVLQSGTLYRYINATPTASNAPPNATYWQVVTGLPSDLITQHLTAPQAPGTIAIGTGGVTASAGFTPLAGDPIASPVSLDDQLADMTAELRARLRWTGAWNNGTAYLANDVASLSNVDYICILPHTGHAPPNATYWVALAGTGGGGTATFDWVVKTASYALTTSDSGIEANAAGGDVTLTLPSAAGITQLFALKRQSSDTSSHAVTIATTGSQTIDGLLTRQLAAGQGYVLGSDGSNWVIYASYLPSPLTTEGDIPYLHNGALARLAVDGTTLTISGGVLSATPPAQAPNTFEAGPTVGANAVPTFRTIVPADLPIASTGARGAVKADGSTIHVAADGTLSATASGSTLASLGDAAISSPQDGDLLRYSSADAKWHNVDPTAPGAGGIYWAPLTDSAGTPIVDANGSCIMMPAAV